MKTGGTLNFLKRAGAIFMLLAIFASSCNKYADDFKQINTKLDALATQVAGVTQLTTDVASLKTTLATLQAAVAALPNPTASIAALTTALTTANTNIATIQTSLTALATAVGTKASTADVTKAVTDVTANIKAELTKQLATMQATIDAANKAIAAAQAANDAQTVAINKAIVDSNTAQSTALTAAITAISAQLTTLSSGTAVTDAQLQASVNALQLLVQGQQSILNQLLAASNMYNGDVTITSIPEMRFYSSKIAQMGIINGNLTINTTNLSTKLDSVNLITSKIGAVIGSQGGVKNAVTVTSTSKTTVLDLSRLVSVSGNYSVAGVVINDTNLGSVGGNFVVNYDGPYSYPNLSAIAGDLTLTKVASSTSTTNPKTGTTSISLPAVAVTGNVYDGSGAGAGMLTYPDATSIALSGGVVSLTAAKATTITLGSAKYDTAPGLTIVAGACTALNLGTITSAAGGLNLTTAAGCALDLSNLAKAAGGLTVAGPTTLTLPLMTAAGSVTSDATTVNMAKYDWAVVPAFAKVTSLTLGAVKNNVVTTTFPTLTTLDVTGASSSTWAGLTGNVTTNATNTVLASVTLRGNLNVAYVGDLAALTSLTTSGIINTLTINNDAVLTGATLAHTHYVGGPGSDLIVTSNPKLTSLSSGVLDYPRTITVTGNPKLTSLTLSSYVTPLLTTPLASTTITINSNKLGGSYTNAVAITATTPYVETTITSATLSGLKAFVAKYPTQPTTVGPNLTLALNLDAVLVGSSTTGVTLSAAMSADAGHTMVPGGAAFNFAAPATGITTQAELTLVK